MQAFGRPSLIALATAGLVAGGVGSASAAPTWLAPTTLSAAGSGGNGLWPRVVVDRQGDATVAWIREAPGRGFGETDFIVEAASRPAGGSWSAPTALSPIGLEAHGLQLGIDGRGNVTAVWSQTGATRVTLRTASRPVDGQWAPQGDVIATLPRDGEDSLRWPQLAVDEQGDASVVWNREVGDDVVVQAADRRDGEWGDPVDISGDDQTSGRPDVARDEQGNATAVWLSNGILRTAARPVRGAWSEPVGVSDAGERAYDPQVVVDGHGSATAVWRSDAPLSDPVVRTASRPADAAWGTPIAIGGSRSAGRVSFTGLGVAVDAEGNALAIWVDDQHEVRTRSRSASGGWARSVSFGYGYGPQVAFDARGDATAIWEGPDGLGSVRAASHPAGGAWSAPVDVHEADGYGPDYSWQDSGPQVAVDGLGNAIAVWTAPTGGGMSAPVVMAAAADGTSPLLGDPSVPSTGVAGQPVNMSVSPFDMWSAVTTTWDFGDGTTATGDAASHTYSSPGERTVTVGGVDAAGNRSATVTRTIVIAPAPDGCPLRCPPIDGPKPGPDAPGPKAPSAAPPQLTGLRQSASRWRLRAARHGRRLPVGTTLRFTLDRAATVRFEFVRRAQGRRGAKGGCAKPTAANRRRPSCTRSVLVGSSSFAGRPGRNERRFRGRLGAKALQPGRYLLRASAVADGAMSATAALPFTIVR